MSQKISNGFLDLCGVVESVESETVKTHKGPAEKVIVILRFGNDRFPIQAPIEFFGDKSTEFSQGVGDTVLMRVAISSRYWQKDESSPGRYFIGFRGFSSEMIEMGQNSQFLADADLGDDPF